MVDTVTTTLAQPDTTVGFSSLFLSHFIIFRNGKFGELNNFAILYNHIFIVIIL